MQLVIAPLWEALDCVRFLDLTADGTLETRFVDWPPSKVPSSSVLFCFETHSLVAQAGLEFRMQ